jgi:radical SAM superfamily enzyme with C-terminal helix-hairpin-helix motif
MAWCSELGILAELEIILGMPTETENNFQENYSYLKRNIKNINFMTIN